MPPKPVVSTKTNEWRRYYICKRVSALLRLIPSTKHQLTSSSFYLHPNSTSRSANRRQTTSFAPTARAHASLPAAGTYMRKTAGTFAWTSTGTGDAIIPNVGDVSSLLSWAALNLRTSRQPVLLDWTLWVRRRERWPLLLGGEPVAGSHRGRRPPDAA